MGGQAAEPGHQYELAITLEEAYHGVKKIHVPATNGVPPATAAAPNRAARSRRARPAMGRGRL